MIYWPSLPEPFTGDQPIERRPAARGSATLTGTEAFLAAQRQRAHRLVVFTDELVHNVRREFGACWLPRPGGRPNPAADALVRAADACKEEAANVRAFLDYLADKPTVEALTALGAFDAERLIRPARELQARADELRARRPAPRPAAAPPPPAQPAAQLAGQMKGWLQRWANVAAPDERPAAVPRPDPVAERARQTFDAARKFASQVLAYVSPRLNVLQVALKSTGLPGKRKPFDEIKRELHPAAVAAGVPEGQLSFLPPLVKLLYGDMGPVRTIHVALVQWEELRGLDGDAEVLAGVMATAPPPRAGELLREFDVGKYRASIYPLSHLHVSFAPIPYARDLFPAPIKEAGIRSIRPNA
ncbi:MAG: hypothetical protein JWM80_209 [Cyanobacteria bacterium RYN_339]|nr:hypothetical protein [Cyanobacteria bacterium RYN_339]